jgi:uncharacterized Zn finger protein (UPF0148 family)
MWTMDDRHRGLILLGFPPCVHCGQHADRMFRGSNGRMVCAPCNHKFDLERIKREHEERMRQMKAEHEHAMAMIEVRRSMDRRTSPQYREACQSDVMRSDLEAVMGGSRLGRGGRIR